jgi:rod shape determining protein RodA
MIGQSRGKLYESRQNIPLFQQWLQQLHLDIPLLLGLLAVAILGIFILYSATGENMAQLQRQGMRLGFGFLVMIILAQISPQTMHRWTPTLFVIGVLLLLGVLFFGVQAKGAQRWLNLGVFRFQPSEVMKIVVPMMLAWFLAESHLPPRFRRLLVCLVLLAIPVVLVAKQPDLGTSLLIASSGIFVLFLAGLSWRLIGGSFVLLTILAWPIWKYVLRDYQRSRVMTFLNPENDPLGAGYHIIQSKIAIGSGGPYGKGWLNGTQSQLDFLPERSTDFIFSVYSEEFGLIGALILLSLYLFLITRGLFIAAQAQNTYSRLLAGSLSMTFFVYVFVNIGMVSGILPVVGVPLPLISYGGTSVVTLLAGFGILMSIHTHRKMLSP